MTGIAKAKVEFGIELDATEARLLAAIAERRGLGLEEVLGEAVTRFVDEALCLVHEKV